MGNASDIAAASAFANIRTMLMTTGLQAAKAPAARLIATSHSPCCDPPQLVAGGSTRRVWAPRPRRDDQLATANREPDPFPGPGSESLGNRWRHANRHFPARVLPQCDDRNIGPWATGGSVCLAAGTLNDQCSSSRLQHEAPPRCKCNRKPSTIRLMFSPSGQRAICCDEVSVSTRSTPRRSTSCT